MRILIVGAGLVGSTLAERLSQDGHDVSLVEKDAEAARVFGEKLDVQIVVGNGSTAPVLRRAGIDHADVVVATTNSDETNMMVALLATSLFGVSRIVVRLHEDAHVEGFAEIHKGHLEERICINPDEAAVDRIASLLEVSGAVDVLSFMGGGLLVAGFRIQPGSDFVGLRVSDMNLLFARMPTLAVAIQRLDDWIIPHGEEEIRAGDLVYFAIAREHLHGVLELVGVKEDERRGVMIAGASPVGLELARRLAAQHVRAVLVEADEVRARAAAEALPDTLVLCGRVTDESLLDEEEVHRIATFVAVDEDHEANLVAGLLAKRMGAGRAVILVDNPALVKMMGQIGIDAIISERVLVIGLALQHIRGRRIHSVAQLLEDQIEIVEAEAGQGGPLTSGPLSEIALPRGVLVAALRRGEKLRVPRGEDRVEAGDRVLLITTTEAAPKLADYLAE